jgi:hypothetical protein
MVLVFDHLIRSHKTGIVMGGRRVVVTAGKFIAATNRGETVNANVVNRRHAHRLAIYKPKNI